MARPDEKGEGIHVTITPMALAAMMGSTGKGGMPLPSGGMDDGTSPNTHTFSLAGKPDGASPDAKRGIDSVTGFGFSRSGGSTATSNPASLGPTTPRKTLLGSD